MWNAARHQRSGTKRAERSRSDTINHCVTNATATRTTRHLVEIRQLSGDEDANDVALGRRDRAVGSAADA